MTDNKELYQQLDELHNFLNEKMDDKERYEFERALYRDPFLAEAVEGIRTIGSSEYERDVLRLSNSKIRPKISLKPLIWIMVILLLAFLAYVATQIKLPEKKSKEDTVERELENMLQFNNEKSNNDQFGNSVDTISADTTTNTLNNNQTEIKKEEVPTAKTVSNTIAQPVPNDRKPEQVIPNEVPNQQVPPTPEEEIGETDYQEDLPTTDPKNSIEQGTSFKISGDTRALPFNGEPNFKSYIENSVTYPETVVKKTKETVKLKFTVNEEGGLENFQMLSGPTNNAFYNEAIRVIKNGPEWSPAVKDGKLVPEEVTLKIVFKP
jgi:TonB family protein